MQTKLFFIRGVVAIAWAAAFATTFDSLTAGTAALLVLYPVIDLVASVIDAWLLRRRFRRAAMAPNATEAPRPSELVEVRS